jgi:hypothetical protein
LSAAWISMQSMRSLCGGGQHGMHAHPHRGVLHMRSRTGPRLSSVRPHTGAHAYSAASHRGVLHMSSCTGPCLPRCALPPSVKTARTGAWARSRRGCAAAHDMHVHEARFSCRDAPRSLCQTSGTHCACAPHTFVRVVVRAMHDTLVVDDLYSLCCDQCIHCTSS